MHHQKEYNILNRKKKKDDRIVIYADAYNMVPGCLPALPATVVSRTLHLGNPMYRSVPKGVRVRAMVGWGA